MYDVVVVSAVLYGAGIVQAWFYYQKYWRKDPMMNKLMVGFVLLCDTWHLNPQAFDRVVKTFVIEVYPSTLIALVVRKYAFIEGSHGQELTADLKLLRIPYLSPVKLDAMADLLAVKNIAMAVDITGAVVDTLISVIMVYLLHSQKGANRKTIDLLNRLIIFTFAAGVPTSICALASAISVAASPDTMTYMFWFLMLGSLYTNSLMVILNARDYIRSKGNNEGIQMSSGLRFHSGADTLSPHGR
ncbi:hypothetical protein B0H19DRAFT_1247942 [Mycena capillaripes]|nr:hypothetical protein B0H19DRAFT_1247942 [Mycena capillaripes]